MQIQIKKKPWAIQFIIEKYPNTKVSFILDQSWLPITAKLPGVVIDVTCNSNIILLSFLAFQLQCTIISPNNIVSAFFSPDYYTAPVSWHTIRPCGANRHTNPLHRSLCSWCQRLQDVVLHARLCLLCCQPFDSGQRPRSCFNTGMFSRSSAFWVYTHSGELLAEGHAVYPKMPHQGWLQNRPLLSSMWGGPRRVASQPTKYGIISPKAIQDKRNIPGINRTSTSCSSREGASLFPSLGLNHDLYGSKLRDLWQVK